MKMAKIVLIALMATLLAAGYSCLPEAPLHRFEADVKTAVQTFGTSLFRMAAFAAPTSEELAILDIVSDMISVIMSYLTDIGAKFLKSIQMIVIDLVLSEWLNPRPVEEVMAELNDKFSAEMANLVKGLDELREYLQEHYFSVLGLNQIELKTLQEDFEAGAQHLVSTLVAKLQEVYQIVHDLISNRDSIIDWLLDFFHLGAIGSVLYALPMSILTRLIQVATQLLFASGHTLSQAQSILNLMHSQILGDVSNAANFVLTAINSLNMILGPFGK